MPRCCGLKTIKIASRFRWRIISKASGRTLGPLLSALIALLLNPTFIPAQTVSQDRELGIRFYSEGKTSEAIAALRAAVKQNKRDGDAWYYLGLALVRIDDMTAARKAFGQAVKLKPQFAPAHTGFSYTLMAASKNHEAEREARTAIQLNPSDANAHYVLGVIHLRFLRNPEAKSEAETAISQRPNFGAAYLLKFQSLLALEGDQAARISKVFDARDPNAPVTEEEKRKRQEEARKRAAIFAEAASALETYLKLVDSDRERSIWQPQLETVRVYARQNAPTAVYSSSEVTTKVRVLSKPEPMYTSEARSAGIAGTVILRSVFTAYGTVENILVLRGLPGGLTAAAIQSARRIKFVPATKDGKPVSMFMQLEYNFNLF